MHVSLLYRITWQIIYNSNNNSAMEFMPLIFTFNSVWLFFNRCPPPHRKNSIEKLARCSPADSWCFLFLVPFEKLECFIEQQRLLFKQEFLFFILKFEKTFEIDVEIDVEIYLNAFVSACVSWRSLLHFINWMRCRKPKEIQTNDVLHTCIHTHTHTHTATAKERNEENGRVNKKRK